MSSTSRNYSSEKDEEVFEEQLNERLLEIKKVFRKSKLTIENEEDLNNIIHSFKERIKILKDKHEYSDLINFYEDKIESTKKKCYAYIQLFSKLLNGLSANNTNRDKMWNKMVMKLQNHIVQLESENENLHKKERIVSYQDNFVELYNNQLEEKYKLLEAKYKKQKKYIHLINEKYQNLKLEKELLERNYIVLKEEYLKCKNKVIEDTKFEWNELKKVINEQYMNITNTNIINIEDPDSKNIVGLIVNMKEYLTNYQDNLKNLADPQLKDILDLDHFIYILDDVKNYILFLLNKNITLTLNNYKIINECCFFHENFKDNSDEKVLMGKIENFYKMLNQLCVKLLFELSPPEKLK